MRIQKLRSLARDQKGLSTVEYTVLLVLIVATAVGMWNTFGNNMLDKLTKSNTELETNLAL